MIVRKRKKKIIIRRKIIIKTKGSHHIDLARHRVLNEVVLVMVLLVEARVLLHRRWATVQEVLVSRDREILAILVLHFVLDAIINILGSVDGVAVDVSRVAISDIEIISVHITSRSLSHLSYCHQLLFTRFQGLVVIPQRVMGEHIIIRGI